MADWRRRIYLQPEWGQAKEYEISIQELAAVIARRLRALKPFDGDGLSLSAQPFDEQLDELAYDFEALSKDPDASTDWFDSVMSELYDWGDQSMSGGWNGKKVCWIDTMSNPANAAAK